MLALMNKPDEANNYLKTSINNGYSKKYARIDPDFEGIRNTPDFKDITSNE
jgi:hypothetical protein